MFATPFWKRRDTGKVFSCHWGQRKCDVFQRKRVTELLEPGFSHDFCHGLFGAVNKREGILLNFRLFIYLVLFYPAVNRVTLGKMQFWWKVRTLPSVFQILTWQGLSKPQLAVEKWFFSGFHSFSSVDFYILAVKIKHFVPKHFICHSSFE